MGIISLFSTVASPAPKYDSRPTLVMDRCCKCSLDAADGKTTNHHRRDNKVIRENHITSKNIWKIRFFSFDKLRTQDSMILSPLSPHKVFNEDWWWSRTLRESSTGLSWWLAKEDGMGGVVRNIFHTIWCLIITSVWRTPEIHWICIHKQHKDEKSPIYQFYFQS